MVPQAGQLRGLAETIVAPAWKNERPAEEAGRPEASTGVEPVMEVLQTSSLPLGYGAETGPKHSHNKGVRGIGPTRPIARHGP